MRIVHVSDSYLPKVGGIELHVGELSARQRGRGHLTTVVTRDPARAHVEDPAVRRVAPGEHGWLDDTAPDVLHAHVAIVSPFALQSVRRAVVRGIPTVVTVHSLWNDIGPLGLLVRDLGGLRGRSVVWSAVSDRAAGPVASVMGVEVHVLPNAVDRAAWAPVGPSAPLDGPPVVLSVMRLTRLKRSLPLLRILRLAAERVDLRAAVVGDGPTMSGMRRYLRLHGLEDRIELCGALDREGIRQRLAAASVFVAPAHRESFGIAALEARASGVPVLASSRSGVGTFVEHGRDGFLAADDLEFVRYLVRLLEDGRLRDTIARHNRETPVPFGWSEVLDRHDQLYAEALARTGTPVPA